MCYFILRRLNMIDKTFMFIIFDEIIEEVINLEENIALLNKLN